MPIDKMHVDQILAAVLLPLVATAAIMINILYYRRGRQLLSDWADERGIRIIWKERRYLRTGPFFLRSSRGQIIYRIVAMNPDGIRRKGGVRIGGFLFGVLSRKISVIWDDGATEARYLDN